MVITGVIRPPPEIRAVADKTALFVAKNGRAFESRILNSDKGKTPKFAFLHDTSPFHAYYEERIRFFEEGGEDDADDQAAKEKQEKEEKQRKEEEERRKQQEERQKKKEKAQKASALDPVARALLSQRSKISEARAASEEAAKNEEAGDQQPIGVVPPPKLSFVSVAAPANLTPVQLETIKLVAQFTALNGKGGPFLQQLVMREWNNPLFAFAQPRHGHFAYFSALVDGYRALLSTWTGKGTLSDAEVLPVAECAGNVSKCLDVAAYRAEFDRDADERRREEMEATGGLSGAALIDWHDFVVVETIDFPVDEVVSMQPPPPPKASAAVEEAEEIMEESDEEDGETIRVVPNYTPKVVSTQNVAQDTSRTHIIDPITGKSVPLADMSEHMRIQLLDPKWNEERQRHVAAQKESNLVAGDVIASNISRFAQARGGLLGSSDAELSGSDADSKKRLEEANRLIREQAQQPQPQPRPAAPAASTTVAGLSLPPPSAAMPSGSQMPPPPPSIPMDQSVAALPPYSDAAAPPAKRPRLEHSLETVPPPPPEGDDAQQYPQPGAIPPPPVAPGLVPPGLPQIPPAEPPKPVEILPEAEFAASLENPTVHLSIQIPNDSSNAAWNFNGQVVALSVNVMSKIKAVKEELRSHLGGMPMNKIQLKSQSVGFLKDGKTLASLNIGPTATLEMVPKTRGGRK